MKVEEKHKKIKVEKILDLLKSIIELMKKKERSFCVNWWKINVVRTRDPQPSLNTEIWLSGDGTPLDTQRESLWVEYYFLSNSPELSYKITGFSCKLSTQKLGGLFWAIKNAEE